MEQHEVRAGDTWRNNKNGKEYKVVDVGRHTEIEGEVMVAYYDAYGQLWIRPYDLFLEKFTLVSREEN